MGEHTDISWCHHTFNMIIGCEAVSEGCRGCYAEADAKRRGWAVWGSEKAGGTRKVMSDAYWQKPLSWNRKAERAGERRRVFCSSMADVFEDHPVVNEQRARLWVPDTTSVCSKACRAKAWRHFGPAGTFSGR